MLRGVCKKCTYHFFILLLVPENSSFVIKPKATKRHYQISLKLGKRRSRVGGFTEKMIEFPPINGVIYRENMYIYISFHGKYYL